MVVCGSYDFVREGDDTVLRMDCEECAFFPSIEENPVVTEMVLRALAKEGAATKIVLVQKRDYEYDYEQTVMLVEISKIFRQADKQRAEYENAEPLDARRATSARYSLFLNIMSRLLLRDPLGAYVELKRIARDEQKLIEDGVIASNDLALLKNYYGLLNDTIASFEKSVLIKKAKPFIAGFRLGDRSLYKRLFLPTVRPDFMFARLMSSYPVGADEIDSYELRDKLTGERTGIDVTIFRLPDTVQFMYHVIPPEFKLTSDKYDLLDAAKKRFEAHQPSRSEFLDPHRLRETFTNLGSDMLLELAEQKGIVLSKRELEDLTKILLRYTIGFGLIEILLQDEQVQDITINSPVGKTPVFLVHNKHDECITNIFPTLPEANSWASKLRMISGRPLDEANPILDTELIIPGARSRLAAIYEPLNPSGLAFALRRHSDEPWTLVKFVNTGMMSALCAGLISFLVDGNRTLLVAGTRSSGKTSLLGAVMVEIMRKRRVITIEDSVTGDSKIVVEIDGTLKHTTIGELIDELIKESNCTILDGREIVVPEKKIRVYSIGKNGKVVLANVSQCVRHLVKKRLFEITTATGRKLKLTEDHSLFTLGMQELLSPVKPSALKCGDYIVVPRVLPNAQQGIETIDLVKECIEKLQDVFLCGQKVQEIIISNWQKIKKLAKELGYSKTMPRAWKREKILPQEIFSGLSVQINGEDVSLKKRTSSTKISAQIRLTPELLTFIGLWLADGSYDKNSIIISVVDEKERAVVRATAAQFGLRTKMHSDKVSLMINSAVLKDVFTEIFGLVGNAYTKRISGWIYGLSRKQIASVLKGFLSGDGCAGDKEVSFATASERLLYDVQTMLLQFGVVLRASARRRSDKTFNARISSTKMLQIFKEEIGFLQNYKSQRLEIIGRGKFCSVVENIPILPEFYRTIADCDILWDKIISLREVNEDNKYVYDFSVPGYENFVCENILAHNTLELPCDALRRLNYNIQSMKVASALTKGTQEVSADEGIRTTLRMGDSALIIGEVRSVEARALYEAMRVGALANIVAGTIHGDSPYGVFDRVVNDLGVPKTSFKATDIIIVANRVRSADGLRSVRKLTQITEVRKFWDDDPLREGGFVDLLKYDAKTELAEPTLDLLSGESEILKAIAGMIKDYAGNWDAVWDNIKLRTAVKQKLVDSARELKLSFLLEAPFVISANDEFHRICEVVKEDTGVADSARILRQWNDWLKNAIKAEQLKRGSA